MFFCHKCGLSIHVVSHRSAFRVCFTWFCFEGLKVKACVLYFNLHGTMCHMCFPQMVYMILLIAQNKSFCSIFFAYRASNIPREHIISWMSAIGMVLTALPVSFNLDCSLMLCRELHQHLFMWLHFGVTKINLEFVGVQFSKLATKMNQM